MELGGRRLAEAVSSKLAHRLCGVDVGVPAARRPPYVRAMALVAGREFGEPSAIALLPSDDRGGGDSDRSCFVTTKATGS